jgi:hypothetical protein
MTDQTWKKSPVPPTGAIAKTLKLRPAEERLALGLGSALVLHWDRMPDVIQDLLIDQAAIVLDDAGLPNAQPDLETLIRTAKVAPLAGGK